MSKSYSLNLTVAIPVLNQHEATERYISTWLETAKNGVRFIFIDNGSEIPLTQTRFWSKLSREAAQLQIVRFDQNIGVYRTFQVAAENQFLNGGSDYIFYSHNDVEMLEFGWDEKICQLLLELESKAKSPGVCGMFGARGLGSPEIYKAPYDFRQLVRWDCITVESMVGAGGRLISKPYERVITLDGFSLIVSKSLFVHGLNKKFDWESYPPHHNYDNDICLSSHFAGYANYVLDVDCVHHGGVTSTREKWAEKMNTTDLQIHRKAHAVMYEKYRGRLPVSV